MKFLLTIAMVIIYVSASGQIADKVPTGGTYKSRYGKMYPIYGDLTNGRYYYQRRPGVWFEIKYAKKRRVKL